MSEEKPLILVTLGGECFEVHLQGKDRAGNRDGVVHYFHLTDLVGGRGTLLVSLFRAGPRDFYAASVDEFNQRIDMVLLNRIRRGFDVGEISFDAPHDQTHYQELRLNPSDFQQQPAASDEQVRQLIVHTAYWISYRPGTRFPVQFDSETDLDYLAVSQNDVRRNQWLLEEDGLLYKSRIPGLGHPTASLVKMYEAKKSTLVGTEHFFPKGTQYEAFKAIKQIFRSATKEIAVADNYMDDSLLDMLDALPRHLNLKLLTSRVAKDFAVAVKKFSAQYQQALEVRTHQKQVHDRFIIIDDNHIYALGASIKDAGNQLFFINKIEDQSNILRLRSEFQTIWATAQPL